MMLPRIPGLTPARTKPVTIQGSGPRGRIQISDIRGKLGEIRGEVDETAERARPVATYVAVGGVILLIAAAFFLGRRRGQHKATWVEIRRL
jgi:hypothetical protein